MTFGTPLCNAAACGTGGGARGLALAISSLGSAKVRAMHPNWPQWIKLLSSLQLSANLLVYVKIPASGDGTADNT